jgi:hypothetical protein
MLIRSVYCMLAAAALVGSALPPSALAQEVKKPQPPKSLRLYVLDCGKIAGGTG